MNMDLKLLVQIVEKVLISQKQLSVETNQA
jgi:hypothetical protein